MEPEPVALSFTLGPSNSPSSCIELVETACSGAKPTVLVSWGLSSPLTPKTESHTRARSNEEGESKEKHEEKHYGVVMGCEDGSVFIWNCATDVSVSPSHDVIVNPRTIRNITPHPIVTSVSNGSRSPTSATRRQQQSPSPSITSRSHPSSLQPLHPTAPHPHLPSSLSPHPRSRATSALSNAEVSAPRNYVDYESEPAKLKEMLKAGSSSKGGAMDGLYHLGLGFGKGVEVDKEREWRLDGETIRVKTKKAVGSEVDQVKEWREKDKDKDKDKDKELSNPNSRSMSMHTSPVLSTNSTSRSSTPSPSRSSFRLPNPALHATPETGQAHQHEREQGHEHDYRRPTLLLTNHCLLSHMGMGHSVRDMKVVVDGEAVVVLQESGTLSLVNTRDGRLISSLHLPSMPIFSPPVALATSLPMPPTSTPGGTAIPGAFKPAPKHALWKYRRLQIVRMGEAYLVLVTASDASPISNQDLNDWTRAPTKCILVQICNEREWEYAERRDLMQKVGELVVGCAIGSVGFVRGSSSPQLYHLSLTPNSHPTLVLSTLGIKLPSLSSHPNTVPRVAAPTTLQHPQPQAQLGLAFVTPSASASNPSSSQPSRTTTPGPPASGSQPLSLVLNVPNPFNLKSFLKKSDSVGNGVDSEKEAGKIEVSASNVVELPGFEKGDQSWVDVRGLIVVVGLGSGDNKSEGTRVLSWTEDCVRVHARAQEGREWRTECLEEFEEIEDVQMIDSNLMGIVHDSLIDTYTVQSHPLESPSPNLSGIEISKLASFPHPSTQQALYFDSSSAMISTRLSRKGFRRLELYPLQSKLKQKGTIAKGRALWTASHAHPHGHKGDTVTPISVTLPLELHTMVLGLADGHVATTSLKDMILSSGNSMSNSYKLSSHNLHGEIIYLEVDRNERTGQKLLFGGADDGSVAVWDFDSLEMLGVWIVFIAPLAQIVILEDERVGNLRGCIFAVSEDGTIATISLDTLELMYLIPGSSAWLDRLYLGEDNLLLLYSDNRARLWDIKTHEFWRSMDHAKAQELVADGGWFKVSLSHERSGPTFLARATVGTSDAASSFVIDLQSFEGKTDPKEGDPKLRKGSSLDIQLGDLQGLLATVLPRGISSDIDILQEELTSYDAHDSRSVLVGVSHDEGTYQDILASVSKAWWNISPSVTAARLLFCLALLRVAQRHTETERSANQLVAFYTASLCETVGHQYQAPSLAYLCMFWYHPIMEVRQSARTLFDATVATLADQECTRIIEGWHHRLPCLQPDAQKADIQAVHSLLITGYMAAHKYSLVSPSVLTDISKSIALYLHDESSPHLVVAIDLCARGFHIWQNYVDAMNLLRSLFSLASGDSKSSPQARLTVLQVASTSTPLFMTTLALDILQPSSTGQQKSIMQLVAFLIRKRPLVLYHNLPRLAEAVVKSLDPNSATGRDAIMDAATEILSQIVKTYPSVDFHKASQRLAVGTNEGAIIMYDLKSATRLYVLEGHKKRIVALSFSPDGRRLVSASLEEGTVLVWKVGTSLASFFTPGAPPRQGHGNSEPYKTLNFSVGDEGNMSLASTFELVKFEWPTDRNARLTIRGNILTFSA